MQPLLVRDVMTDQVVTVRSFAKFREITAAMLEREVGALPVVDSMGHPLGVVSRTDLVAKQARPGAWEKLTVRGRKAHATARATTAARLMTEHPITVTPDATLTRAAHLMQRHAITHLPVVDEHNVVIGIVARGDLLGMFLRADDAIREDVVRDVLIEGIDAEPGTIDVTVADGIVTVTGMVDYASTADYALREIGTIPGVIDVVDKLKWRTDDTRPHAAPMF
jgi:CBS-domain-containing membrane protein